MRIFACLLGGNRPPNAVDCPPPKTNVPMSLSLFMARRLHRADDNKKQTSRPAVVIATVGIAIGLAVMLVAVSVIVGFKHEVRDKVVGFGAHIQVANLEANSLYESRPVETDSALLSLLSSLGNVSHLQRYSLKPGMIKTEDAFQGIVLKGLGQEYDTTFFSRHLTEGALPQFGDTASSSQVLLSRTLADKLRLTVGSKIDAYFIENGVRTRRFRVAGIYQTNFSEYDNLFLLTDLYTVNRLNNWKLPQTSGVEVTVKDYSKLEETTWSIADALEETRDTDGQRYGARNIEQLNPGIFAWLSVLNVNIWVILILMLGVAGFTMISGLLILIIERTSMIGILKSLGADNSFIRRTFLWLAVWECLVARLLHRANPHGPAETRPRDVLHGHCARTLQPCRFCAAQRRDTDCLGAHAGRPFLSGSPHPPHRLHALRISIPARGRATVRFRTARMSENGHPPPPQAP